MSDSQVTIIGSLGRDAELRFTAGGAAICSFTVAVSHRYKKADDWQEETAWVDVTAWSNLAENIAASCVKGTRVICVGRLKQDTWQDKDSGKDRTKLVLVADSVGPDLRWATAEVARIERSQ